METHPISDLPTSVLSYHIARQSHPLKHARNNSIATQHDEEGVPDSGLKWRRQGEAVGWSCNFMQTCRAHWPPLRPCSLAGRSCLPSPGSTTAVLLCGSITLPLRLARFMAQIRRQRDKIVENKGWEWYGTTVVPTPAAPTWHGRGREGRRGRGRTSLRPLPCCLVARPRPTVALSRRPLLRRLVVVAGLRPLLHRLVTVAGAGEGKAGEEEAAEGVVVTSANLTQGGAPRWGEA
jgi:hypothetical protein